MGRFVTPAGVVIEMSDAAAVAVGYQPEQAPVDAEKAKPKRKPGRPKKSE